MDKDEEIVSDKEIDKAMEMCLELGLEQDEAQRAVEDFYNIY